MCYDSKTDKWTYKTPMIKSREHGSCSVFEGKLVVSGGWNRVDIKGVYNCLSRLSSVEAYYAHENKWVRFPDMLGPRGDHDSVSMGNKMFVIGGRFRNNCEVYDSITNKFTCIEELPKLKGIYYHEFKSHLVNIGRRIYVFQQIGIDGETIGNVTTLISKIAMFYYDVQKKVWSSESSEPLLIKDFCVAKMFVD